MDKIRNQDLENLKEDQRKKDITRQYMENAYAEKAEKKRREKEEERLQKEKERQYQQHVSKRENDLNDKTPNLNFYKNKSRILFCFIHNLLSYISSQNTNCKIHTKRCTI